MSEFYGLSADEVAVDWMRDALERLDSPGGEHDAHQIFKRKPDVVTDYLNKEKRRLAFVLPKELQPFLLDVDKPREDWEVDQPVD